MLRVFISGKITGTNDYLERFSRAEQELCERGHDYIFRAGDKIAQMVIQRVPISASNI